MCVLVVSSAYGHWGEEGWHLPEGGTSSSRVCSFDPIKNLESRVLVLVIIYYPEVLGRVGQMSSFPQYFKTPPEPRVQISPD
jgi:hypothetical protein